MKTLITSALTLCLPLIAAPGIAETLRKVPAELDPTKAYVLIEYRLRANTLSGFPGSSKHIPFVEGLDLARFDPVLGDIRGRGKASANPVPGDQPTESFRSRPIAKAEGSRMSLLALQPDVWVVQGYGNTSFSLGSYSFVLEPGTITDLGVVEAEQDWAEGDGPLKTGDVAKMALLGLFAKRPAVAPMRLRFRPRTAQDMPLPAGLPADRVRPVVFTPGARFGNYLGGLVNRIEGVNARLRESSTQP